MQYPLDLSFKVITLIPQIYIKDATGASILYVRQKILKLKEEVTVYADPNQNNRLYTIKADRVIDWSARYTFSDINGVELGSVKRHGTQSIWKAHYDIYDGLETKMTIREANPFIKVADAIFGQIPILAFLTGYLFHPTYNVMSNQDGRIVMQLKKQPSFFESKFIIEKDAGLEQREEKVVLLSLLMMILLERKRG
ncbi:hypothetical protein ACFLWX_04295 [Chloroflexota bacterium]